MPFKDDAARKKYIQAYCRRPDVAAKRKARANSEEAKALRRALYPRDKKRIAEDHRKHYDKNRAKILVLDSARHRQRNTGFTPELFARAISAQNGFCAICKCDLAALPPHRVHADHDHTTGAPRGVLCGHCNTGLGYFTDSKDNLLAAVRYLGNPPLGGTPI